MTMLLGLIALCLAWLLPGHYDPWRTFQQEAVAGAGAVLIGLAAVATRKSQPVRWPPLAVVTLAIAIVPLLQLAAGQIRFHSDAILAAFYLVAFALTMVAGASLVRSRRNELIGGLFMACLVAGIVSTGLAAVQWLQLGPIGYVADLPPGARPFANLAQPNHLASLLALAIVALTWCFETRRIGAATTTIGLGWLAFGLVMTQSRSAWMFVVAYAAASLLMRRKLALRTPPWAIAAAVLLFGALVAGWGALSNALEVYAQSFEQRAQPGPRMMLWHALIDALTASPWSGYGWNQVGLATQVAAVDHVMQRGTLNQSHSLILDLVLWNGVPLGLAIVGFLCWWFVRRVRRVRDAEEWLMLAAVGAIFLHEMVEFPLEYAYFLVPVGLLMGALDGLDANSGWTTPRMTFAAPLMLSAGLLGWVCVEYMKVEEATRQVRLIVAGIGVDKVAKSPPPDVWLLDAWREIHRFWLVAPREGMTEQELDWMRLVQERYAVPPFQARYAIAAGLNGKSEEASRALIRLCHMHQPDRCRGWHGIWLQLQRQHPALNDIPFPAQAKQVLAAAQK